MAIRGEGGTGGRTEGGEHQRRVLTHTRERGGGGEAGRGVGRHGHRSGVSIFRRERQQHLREESTATQAIQARQLPHDGLLTSRLKSQHTYLRRLSTPRYLYIEIDAYSHTTQHHTKIRSGQRVCCCCCCRRSAFLLYLRQQEPERRHDRSRSPKQTRHTPPDHFIPIIPITRWTKQRQSVSSIEFRLSVIAESVS